MQTDIILDDKLLSFPKVSVCVITYNHEKYIGQCLESILEQKTNFSFEIIVGDDYSTDSTRSIILDYASKNKESFVTILHNKNHGPTKNLLSAINLARGKYIAHCDGDDHWLPGKLQAQIEILENHEEISGVLTNAIVNCKPFLQRNNRILCIGDELRTIFTDSQLFRSSMVERRKNLTSTSEYMTREAKVYDFEMYWLAHHASKLYLIGHPYVVYSQNPDGISRKSNIMDDYLHAVHRLRGAGLPTDIYESMILNNRISRYFRSYDENERVSIIEYCSSCSIRLGHLIRLFIPAKIMRFIKSIRQHQRSYFQRK